MALIGTEAVDALVLVHSAWAMKLMRDEKDGAVPDGSTAAARDAEILEVVKAKSSVKRHDYMLSASGVLGAIQTADQMGDYLALLSESYESTEDLRAPARRVRPDSLQTWSKR